MPDIINPNNMCMFINDDPSEYPKVVDGQLITILTGPFDTEEECAAAGPPCGCGGGRPAVIITCTWTDTSQVCREFFDLIWKNGDTYTVCPDYYKKGQRDDPTAEIYSGHHTWRLGGTIFPGLDMIRHYSIYYYNTTYGWFGGDTWNYNLVGLNAYAAVGGGSAGLAAYGEVKYTMYGHVRPPGNTYAITYGTAPFKTMAAAGIPSINNYDIPNQFFGSATMADGIGASPTDTVTFSWSRGPGDWVTPTA